MLERKKNPQYEYCAVIVAEDITSRFLNVISLFNGFIPLIAIQVKAVKIENSISLFFTKVLDETKFELLEEDSISEPTDKEYWKNRATKETLKLTENFMKALGDITSEYQLKYNKHYIGLGQIILQKTLLHLSQGKVQFCYELGLIGLMKLMI